MTISVAELLHKHQIDVAELTNRAGLDESKVLAIVMGRWTPSPKERERIASVFEVTIDDITWGHKTPIQHIYGHGPG